MSEINPGVKDDTDDQDAAQYLARRQKRLTFDKQVIFAVKIALKVLEDDVVERDYNRDLDYGHEEEQGGLCVVECLFLLMRLSTCQDDGNEGACEADYGTHCKIKNILHHSEQLLALLSAILQRSHSNNIVVIA